MTSLEIKTEIQRAVDKVPENILPEILDYINSKQQLHPDKKAMEEFIERVFQEDDNLFKTACPMIDLKIVLDIHEKSIKQYGGGDGLRDKNLLLSAIERPFQTFYQQDLYPTPEDKAAAILESLIINHPFIDGNKRTAYVMLRYVLFFYGFDVMAFEDEKYQFTIAASSGQIRFDEIKLWIQEHLISVNP